MIRLGHGAAIGLALTLVSCGYFNYLYNANRQFAEAQRAATRGELGAARQAYNGTIEKAARSYRKYPRGRWADDALYLIARSRFELAEYPAARAAALELLGTTADRERRGAAHALIGASELQLSQAGAVERLDSAIALLPENAELRPFAHLWRARARAAAGKMAGAWADLDATQVRDERTAHALQLERIQLAIAAGDSVRAAAAFANALASNSARAHLDMLAALTDKASAEFGGAAVRTMLDRPLTGWPAPARDSISLLRAEIALRAADTISAHHELLQLAGGAAANIASLARVQLARSRLASVSGLEQLAELRALLLPAVANPNAFSLIRTMRLVAVLVQRARETGQPAALFAAAEVARDELRAPLLARVLFTTYAEVAPQTPWAAKALLAAIALAPESAEAAALRTRLAEFAQSPYLTFSDSAQNGALASAEERLQRSLTAARLEGVRLADEQESEAGRAVSALDSVRLAALNDSTRTRCGLLIDTLAVVGLRADSVRAACMRADTVKVAQYLKVDTAAWLNLGADSIRARRNTRTVRTDTIR